ncbi:MAG TPA: Fis family transcriptional regulator [Chlorobaculum sp.]|uniref:Sigma-54-dependent transcriptional regulator n=2 Tax=Chlorobaculum tepidum TaxID=1097 RepID=Q8KG60_CHLTE|nr:sigma-54-dependent transcriptional regulator [Chlorobaculum tepidum TLS]HBU24366.1 Fis family transcriptional regulator [Chlorobaculum sp.]
MNSEIFRIFRKKYSEEIRNPPMNATTLPEALKLMQYIGDAIGTIRDPQELFRTVTDKLRLLFAFDSAVIITIDRERREASVFFEMLRFELPEQLRHQTRSIAGTWLEGHLDDRTVTVASIARDIPSFGADGAPLLWTLHELGMRQIVLSPLRSGGRVIGFLSFVSAEEKLWSDGDKSLLSGVSSSIAIAVSNALAYEELRQREAETSMQLAINNALFTIKDRSQMLLTVCEQISRLVPCSFLGIRVVGSDGRFHIYDNFMRGSGSSFAPFSPLEHLEMLPDDPVARESIEVISRPGIYSGERFDELCRDFRILELVRDRFGISSIIVLQLWDLPGSRAGLIISGVGVTLGDEEARTVSLIVPQLALALQNYLAFDEIDRLRRKLEGERTYLVEEIRAAHNFEEIVGNSAPLAEVLRRVSQVAPTDATVLIEGETGTGKELIARAIHNLSPRKERVLVKVNCAALPASLIESELFGHEKGSFTGATERRIGKFELADGGTIFLDEIGELPLELQAKLLRVLQEKELERIGGRRVIPVDVRVIAATNRDLKKEVATGRFRQDLYFRLNAFPLSVPPLRERRDDIPVLALHFARKFAREFGKPERAIRERDMNELVSREWRGNIRELSHTIEQAVIVAEGDSLDFSTVLPLRNESVPLSAPSALMTMAELEEEMRGMERKLILDALDRAGGRVSGEGGAAELLKINAKTLYSRIDKLGIRKRYGAG